MKNMKYVGSHETTKGATMKNSFEIQNATADFSDYYSKNSISANTQSNKIFTILVFPRLSWYFVASS